MTLTPQQEADVLLAGYQAMKRSGAAQRSPQMSEMVERVARALHSVRSRETIFDNLSRTIRGHYMTEARATIEAMREPTEAMVKAAQPIARDNYPDDLWRAMIDKALEKSK